MLTDKLKTFEDEVVGELRNATKYLDLKAYDASIEKVEKDVQHFFKELAQIKSE